MMRSGKWFHQKTAGWAPEEPLSAKLEWILCHFLASKNAVPQFTVFDFTNFPLTRRVFFLCKVSRYLITIYIFVLIDFVPTNNQNLLMTHCENWGCFWRRVIETLICHTRTLWHFCCCLCTKVGQLSANMGLSHTTKTYTNVVHSHSML